MLDNKKKCYLRNKIFYNELDLADTLSNYVNVYIYGAGYVGKMVEKRLKYRHINVKGFIVSDVKSEEQNESDNIYSIEMIEKSSQTIVVVAVTNTYRDEIVKNINRYEDCQYIIVSDKLIAIMERFIHRRLHFQTHLVEHCNLKCRGCYHFSSLAKEEYLDLGEFESDLKRLSELFFGEAEEILLLGGEPLLHPQINSFLELARRYFPIGKIKILTNGILLLDIEDKFFESLKENEIQLWVTKYPVKFNYEKAENRAKEFGVNIHYFAMGEEIRTLGHEPLDLSGKRDYKENFYHCYRANECVDLKHGKLYPCIIPAEIGAFRDYFHIDIPTSEDDFVDIYKVQDADELLMGLEREIPFCRFCNREDVQIVGKIPWSVSKFNIKEWTE